MARFPAVPAIATFTISEYLRGRRFALIYTNRFDCWQSQQSPAFKSTTIGKHDFAISRSQENQVSKKIPVVIITVSEWLLYVQFSKFAWSISQVSVRPKAHGIGLDRENREVRAMRFERILWGTGKLGGISPFFPKLPPGTRGSDTRSTPNRTSVPA